MSNPIYQSHHEVHPQKRSIGWGYLIMGVLFIIASVLSFINPAGNLEALAFAFAFLAILNGIWMIANRMGSTLRVVAGVVNILIGVFLFFNIYWAALALPFVFAIWFIVDSVLRLLTVGFARALGSGFFWFQLIISILGIIVGVLLLYNPISAALTISFLVGFYLLMAGIESIVYAFSRPPLSE